MSAPRSGALEKRGPYKSSPRTRAESKRYECDGCGDTIRPLEVAYVWINDAGGEWAYCVSCHNDGKQP